MSAEYVFQLGSATIRVDSFGEEPDPPTKDLIRAMVDGVNRAGGYVTQRVHLVEEYEL